MVSDKVNTLISDCVAELPSCAIADIRTEAARKCKEFCLRSRVWRETCLLDKIPAGSAQIYIGNATDGARINTLDRVYFQGSAIERARITWALGLNAQGADTLILSRSPDIANDYSLIIRFTLSPSIDFVMPEWIYDEYGDYIAQGVIARLKRRNKRPYTDLNGSALAEREWRKGIGFAAARMANKLTIKEYQVTGWTVGEGEDLREVASVPTYGQLVKSFRTLVEDLVARGLIPSAMPLPPIPTETWQVASGEAEREASETSPYGDLNKAFRTLVEDLITSNNIPGDVQ